MAYNPYKKVMLKKQFDARIGLRSGGFFIGFKSTTYYDNIEKYIFRKKGASDQSFGTLRQAKTGMAAGAPRTKGGKYLTAGGVRAAYTAELDIINVKNGGSTTDHGNLTNAKAQMASASSCSVMLVGGGRNSPGFFADIDKIQFSTSGSTVGWGSLISVVQQVQGYGNDNFAYFDRGLIIGNANHPKYFQKKCFKNDNNTSFFLFGHAANRNGQAFVCSSVKGYSVSGSYNIAIRQMTLKTFTTSSFFGNVTQGLINMSGAASENEVLVMKGSRINTFTATANVEYFCMKTKGNSSIFVTAGSTKQGTGSHGAS